MTLAGRNTCHIYEISWPTSRPEAYQANTVSKRDREGIQNLDSLIEPSGQWIIATSRLTQPPGLLVKDGNNGIGRVNGLELDGEWVTK